LEPTVTAAPVEPKLLPMMVKAIPPAVSAVLGR